jgi:hypothetical protein
MKRQLLLLLLLSSAFSFLKAQHYFPLPDSNLVWVIGANEMGTVSYSNNFTDTINKDTSINASTYTKVYNDSHIYLGAYRSDTLGKTYYVPPDSLQEFLIMDLAKNPGDSVKNVYISPYYSYPGGLTDLYVDSVGYSQAGPYLLKRLYVSNNTIYNGTMTPLVWMEKIGTSLGILNYFYITPNVGYWLECMYYNDTTYYDNYLGYDLFEYSHGQCTISVDAGNSPILSRLNIFPNPTYNKLTLDNICQKTLLSIYNIQGQLQVEKMIAAGKTEMDLSGFENGVYILRLSNNDNIFVTKILKK